MPKKQRVHKRLTQRRPHSEQRSDYRINEVILEGMKAGKSDHEIKKALDELGALFLRELKAKIEEEKSAGLSCLNVHGPTVESMKWFSAPCGPANQT